MTLRRAPIESLVVDGLTFSVRWSRRRRTVGLTVGRDGALAVAAPARLGARRLETIVRGKLPWVRRKLAEFAAEGPPPTPLRLDDGDVLPYLGRSYRLVRVAAPPAPVGLRRGRLELDDDLDGDAREALIAWYTRRARQHLEHRAREFAPLVGATPDELVVRDLGMRRWGVCDARRRRVTLHWELVYQEPALIDYVVVHELAHLHEPNHGPRFWARVAAVLPDWRERRARLRTAGRHGLF